MARPLRFTPPGGLVEVTNRTIQGRWLLRPSPRMNELFLGVLGRALQKFDVEIVAVVCMSNHLHALLLPRDAEALADFMEYLSGNLSKKVIAAAAPDQVSVIIVDEAPPIILSFGKGVSRSLCLISRASTDARLAHRDPR